MKKALKYFAAILSAAIFCLALAACGESAGTKYNFKDTKGSVDITADAPTMVSGITAMETVYNTSYANSVIEVKEGEIIWEIAGEKSTMTYTMEGEKYILAGELTQQFSQGLSSFGQNNGVELYGQKTEEGFTITMVETIGGNPYISSVTFTFYFTAA